MKYLKASTHDGGCITSQIKCYVCNAGICGWETDADVNDLGRQVPIETTIFHGAEYCKDEDIVLCSTHALLHRAVACDTFARLTDAEQERERVAEGHI